MLAAMLQYFAAEKRESMVFMGVGLVAFAAGYFLLRDGGVFRSAAYPLIIVAIIQLIVGSTIYFRTDGQVETLSAQLASEPQAYRTDETARMVRVMSSFRLYKILEIVLIIVALFLLAVFRLPSSAVGIGAGLLLQASIMLVADIVAENRGQLYLDAVSRLTST